MMRRGMSLGLGLALFAGSAMGGELDSEYGVKVRSSVAPETPAVSGPATAEAAAPRASELDREAPTQAYRHGFGGFGRGFGYRGFGGFGRGFGYGGWGWGRGFGYGRGFGGFGFSSFGLGYGFGGYGLGYGLGYGGYGLGYGGYGLGYGGYGGYCGYGYGYPSYGGFALNIGIGNGCYW